ncbi:MULTISPECIES: molybdopterin converting factor subunit 1 [unclassified Beijerinckia]|uniref:molybdopterin converting factor subunit 1 n=1 Tax=unclassified Beijerinckia TaxID=2638183 RepID=UPI000B85AB28|nr:MULTISPECIES: molybdopterin converting factor subunit 1 [unclassified Beijerinckia]
MKLSYFAWVRERIGLASEQITPPPQVRTVGELIAWLSARGEEYAYAFERPHIIRAAIDRVHVKHETPIAGAREIAFFPPMTGG